MASAPPSNIASISDSANGLFELLAEEVPVGVEIPDITGPVYQLPQTNVGPLFAVIAKLGNNHLTEQKLDGKGTFDALMGGFKVHLKEEFEQGRITGEFYAKAYVELTTAAMGNAVQYLLGKETSYWQSMAQQMTAQAGEAQVVTARIETEMARTKLAGMALDLEGKAYEIQSQRAIFATNKIRLASESMAYTTAKYQLDNLLPLQVEMQTKQIDQISKAIQLADGELSLIPSKVNLANAQVSQAAKQNNMLDGEISMIPFKITLMQEQSESQRAQTLDTRSDGVPVSGTLGKQRQLYDQQITSYLRDAEMKAAKLFTDAWVTMKTIDEGLLAPNGFTNASLDQVLTRVKLNNNLGA